MILWENGYPLCGIIFRIAYSTPQGCLLPILDHCQPN
jgi:hypothetical protein